MSIVVSKAVWSRSRARGAARLVLLCLAEYANHSGVAWPSVRTIQQKTLVSERQVRRCIARLAAEGEIEIQRKGNGRGHRSVYRVLLLSRGKSVTTGPDQDDRMSSDPAGIHQKEESTPICRPDREAPDRKRAEEWMQIPESLRTVAFAAAWDAYRRHRWEINKPLTMTAGRRILDRLNQVGEREAIARIDLSIENGWQGLFYPGDESRFARLRGEEGQEQVTPELDETTVRLLARLEEHANE